MKYERYQQKQSNIKDKGKFSTVVKHKKQHFKHKRYL